MTMFRAFYSKSSVFTLSLSLLLASAVVEGRSTPYEAPISCESSNWNPTAWTHYHDLELFELSKQAILFDICLNNVANNSQAHITLRACATDTIQPVQSLTGYNQSTRAGLMQKREIQSSEKDDEAPSDVPASAALSGLISYLKLNPFQPTLLSFQDGIVAGFYIHPIVSVQNALLAMSEI